MVNTMVTRNDSHFIQCIIYSYLISQQPLCVDRIGIMFSINKIMCAIHQLWVAKGSFARLKKNHILVYLILCVAIIVWLQDDPCFLLHFDKVRTVTAISSSAKYSIVRALLALSEKYCEGSLNLQNFDWAYIKPTSFYSNRGDCVVLSQICFYAFNLVCLSMCPVPLDA